MKKTSKFIGALGLSAALVIGTAMPAFAVTSDEYGMVDESGSISSSDGAAESTGETTVYMAATQTQIDATVPLAIAVYASSTGGPLTTPRESAYTITNNSADAKLYVSKVESTLLSEDTTTTKVDWTAASEDTLSAAGTSLPSKAYNATSNALDGSLVGQTAGSSYPVTANYGTVFVNMTAGQLSNQAYDSNKTLKAYSDGGTYIKQNMLDESGNVVAYDGVQTLTLVGGATTATANSGYKFSEEVGWEMEANNASKDNLESKIGLRLEGYASQLNVGSAAGQLGADKLVKLMKITYTVQASSKHFENQMVETEFKYPALAS